MNRLSLLAVAALALAGPASAQDPAQIRRAATASCPGCNLFQADFTNRQMKSRNYSKARLRQANLSAAIMNGTNFSGADLRDVNAYGGLFTSANFSGADLTNASFVGAYLQGANFRGANLTGTNFAGAEMNRAIGLTQAQLNAACGDSSTLVPRGLRLRAC